MANEFVIKHGMIVREGTATVASLAGTGTRVTTATSTGQLQALANGTNTHVLTLVGGVPTWAAPSGGSGTLPSMTGQASLYLTNDGTNAYWATANGTTPTIEEVLVAGNVATTQLKLHDALAFYDSANDVYSTINTGDAIFSFNSGYGPSFSLIMTGLTLHRNFTLPDASGTVATQEWVTANAGGGSGTVTSVGLSLPAMFDVTNSPVTTTGTLTAALAMQSANTVLAGPTSGGGLTPSFRLLSQRDVYARVQTAWSSSINLNAALFDMLAVTLTANTTINVTYTESLPDGFKITMRLKQDATGSRTVTWGANIRLGTDITSTTLTTTANKTDYIGLVYNGPADKWDLVSFIKGF